MTNSRLVCKLFWYCCLTLIGLSFLSNIGFAQENKLHHLSLQTGLLIPLGKFAANQAENDGFAETGQFSTLSAFMTLYESYGIWYYDQQIVWSK